MNEPNNQSINQMEGRKEGFIYSCVVTARKQSEKVKDVDVSRSFILANNLALFRAVCSERAGTVQYRGGKHVRTGILLPKSLSFSPMFVRLLLFIALPIPRIVRLKIVTVIQRLA